MKRILTIICAMLLVLGVSAQKKKAIVAYFSATSGTRKDVFMICETWENQEVLDAHSASAPFQTLVPQITDCGEMKIESFNS